MIDGPNKEDIAESVFRENWVNSDRNNPTSIKVLSFKDRRVVAKVNNIKNINYWVKGKVVLIWDSNLYRTGVITGIDKDKIEIYSSEPLDNPTKVSLKEWWNIGLALSYLVSYDGLQEELGTNSTLELNFEVPPGTPKFTIKWSLYYSEAGESYTEIIKGSDWEKAGYSKITLSDYLWKEGYYRIRARRLSPNRAVSVNNNFYDFPKKESADSTLLISRLNSIKL